MNNAWFLLALAILAEVIGTSFLKASDGMSRWWPSIMVVVNYGIAFYCLSKVLQSIPVGIAYAIWSGVGIALLTLIGWIVFKQQLNFSAVLGIALIIAGVVVLNISSTAGGH